MSMPRNVRFITADQWRGEAHWADDVRAPVDRGIEQALGLTSDQCAMTVIRGESGDNLISFDLKRRSACGSDNVLGIRSTREWYG